MPKNEMTLLGTTGDKDAITYGGGVVYVRNNYAPVWEWIDDGFNEPETDDDGEEIESGEEQPLYRETVPDDVFAAHDWAKPGEMARSIGTTASELRALGRGSVMERVEALSAIAAYYGSHELDGYPLMITRSALEKRWGEILP
jgi:hypothetical protein